MPGTINHLPPSCSHLSAKPLAQWTPEERLAAVVASRTKATRDKTKCLADGWTLVNKKKGSLHQVRETNRPDDQKWIKTNISAETPVFKIFDSIFPLNFAVSLIQRNFLSDPENSPSLLPTRAQIIFYLAVRVRIQAKQPKTTESNPVENPQRDAIKEAGAHFPKKVIGINKTELYHSLFYLDEGEEMLLNGFIPNVVTRLGNYVSCDEKLFKYGGKFAWKRKKKGKGMVHFINT